MWHQCKEELYKHRQYPSMLKWGRVRSNREKLMTQEREKQNLQEWSGRGQGRGMPVNRSRDILIHQNRREGRANRKNARVERWRGWRSWHFPLIAPIYSKKYEGADQLRASRYRIWLGWVWRTAPMLRQGVWFWSLRNHWRTKKGKKDPQAFSRLSLLGRITIFSKEKYFIQHPYVPAHQDIKEIRVENPDSSWGTSDAGLFSKWLRNEHAQWDAE